MFFANFRLKAQSFPRFHLIRGHFVVVVVLFFLTHLQSLKYSRKKKKCYFFHPVGDGDLRTKEDYRVGLSAMIT